MDYGKIPSNATLKPLAFRAKVTEEELTDFEDILKASKVGPQTFENQQEDRRFGLTHKWLAEAKRHWETYYSW